MNQVSRAVDALRPVPSGSIPEFELARLVDRHEVAPERVRIAKREEIPFVPAEQAAREKRQQEFNARYE